MKRTSRILGIGLVLTVLLAFYFGPKFGPIHNGIHKARQSPQLQKLHGIGLAMFSYAHDNGGNYPDGKSSTEVFQKLIDGGYGVDPALYYLPGAGKIAPVAGQKLKPENVGFDVTSGATLKSPGPLPIVFVTGYKVIYAPGGSTVPIIKPYPEFCSDPARTWTQWWNGEPNLGPSRPGIGVFYLNNSAAFKNLSFAPDGSRYVHNFISPDYKSDGRTYRQLTPDGTLAP